MRGSQAAWDALKATPEKISDDTLYFIYQNAQASTDGKLYLGQKLISGTGGSFTGDININDIGDVYIDDEILADKQILVFNDTSQQWENTSLSTIINTAVGVMVGASAAAAGQAGLVPVPAQGDQDNFLRGDGSWATINIPTFDTQIFSVLNNEVTLNDFALAAVGDIPIKTSHGLDWMPAPLGTLNREITTLEKLQAQLAGTDLDPIDLSTIYMVPNGNDSSSENIYDEYMVINNTLERLGTFGQVNLNNYVTVSTFNSAIDSLHSVLYDTTDIQAGTLTPGLISRVSYIEENYVTQAQIGDLNNLILSGNNSTLVEEVNSLGERLKWHDLSSEV